jgi:hypothetical protein
MKPKDQRELKAKLIATNKKTVGGIQIPRQVAIEKKTQPKKALTVEAKVVDKMSKTLDALPEFLTNRPAFNPEPSMPGFKSF